MSNRSRFFSSSNPFLTEQVYTQSTQNAEMSHSTGTGSIGTTAEHMTVSGAVNKSLILGGILVGTAVLAAYILNPILMWVGLIGGLVTALIAYARPTSAPITAPIYAAFQGLLLGTISTLYALAFAPGVVVNAILLTMLALFTMLILYKAGIIRATEKFRSIIMTATGAIALIYVVNLFMHMFGTGLPFLHQMSPIGIIISLVIIAIAALNLILDFDQFERGEQAKAPIHMEWLSAMGLLVTLVWLYLEILRLLAMFSSRD